MSSFDAPANGALPPPITKLWIVWLQLASLGGISLFGLFFVCVHSGTHGRSRARASLFVHASRSRPDVLRIRAGWFLALSLCSRFASSVQLDALGRSEGNTHPHFAHLPYAMRGSSHGFLALFALVHLQTPDGFTTEAVRYMSFIYVVRPPTSRALRPRSTLTLVPAGVDRCWVPSWLVGG
jgi:hypothetical protein